MRTWTATTLSPLELAFIGDAVWEVYARNHVLGLGLRKPAVLHKRATAYVSATAQAYLVQALWDGLTVEEQDRVRKGRNAKSGHVRKNADVLDYRHSTGFEALIGYLYGTGQQQRLRDLCQRALVAIDEKREDAHGN
ncbi:ribonuclease III [Alicyclobacillaceae bacterium I2511]|nr:ribonuclease III [Alicyclobacillaceae bacterium I2511]